MIFCYKCGKEITKTFGFCPHCGADLSAVRAQSKKSSSVLGGILALLTLGGFVIGVFLLLGGIIAVIMNPVIKTKVAGDRVWAIGLLVWRIFYQTGLINHCFLIGIISLGIGIGSYVLMDKLD